MSQRDQGQPEPFYFSDYFILPTSALAALISGVGSSLLWVAQGNYISECACPRTKGFFFGYFWAFYMASQVAGNLLGAFVFQNYNLVAFYMLMSGFSVGSGFVFALLKKTVPVGERASNLKGLR